MAAISGKEIGKLFLKALGLEGRSVRVLTIRCNMYDPVLITIETEAIDVPNGVDGLEEAAKILTKYHLVEEESDHET